MLFVTNRKFDQSIRSKANRKVTFDFKDNAPGNSVYFCRRDGEDDYTEIRSPAFLEELKASDAKQLLFLIHGFSNLPEPDIFPNAQRLQKLFDAKQKGLMLVVPIIWPCDSDPGIVKDYWDDQKSADLSAYSFSRVLQKFIEWRNKSGAENPCLKRINVLAHSMGNRVFRETLSAWNRYDLASGVPLIFRNTFLMAADIVNESLEPGKRGDLITQASRNVTVYFASDDLALRASKVSNLKNKIASRRLGHTGPEDMSKVPSNVYSIDCDNFNNAYDYPKGHTYFFEDENDKPGKVFDHLFNSLKTGRVHVDDEVTRRHILDKRELGKDVP